MDFLDPKKRRQHRIRLFIGYGLMAIALAIATTVLFFEASGYDISRESGRLIQNGILFVDSHPESAEIYINDEFKGQTGQKYVIPEDTYSVRLHRDGYHDWRKEFGLKGGTIERLVYPFMIPEDIEREDAILYSALPAMTTQSPDRRWLVQQLSTKSLELQISDLSGVPIRTRSITVSPQIFSGPASKTRYNLKPIEWSDDNRHFIVEHSFEGGKEFIRVDRENPEESINLTEAIDTPFSDIKLRDKNYDQFYVYEPRTDQLLYQNTIDGNSELLAEKVIDFQSHASNEVVYVASKRGDAENVAVYVNDGSTDLHLRDLPVSKTGYIIDIARFDGNWVIAVGARDDSNVYVYRGDLLNELRDDNREPTLTKVLRVDSVIDMGAFSGNTRFFAIQANENFAIYDAEHDRIYIYNVSMPVSDDRKAYGMDGHRLTIVSEGSLFMFDFDGINMQKLADVQRTTKPMFDRDYDRLFSLGDSLRAEGRFALQQAYMRIEADR